MIPEGYKKTIRGLEPIGRNLKSFTSHPGDDESYKPLGKEAGFEVDAEGRTVGGYVFTPAADVSTSPYLLLVVCDVFGWRLRQTRRFIDALAGSLQCHAVLPDVLRGSSVDQFVWDDVTKDYGSWSASNPVDRVVSDLTAVAEGIAGAKNLEGVILVGLGWGATAAIHAAMAGVFPVHSVAAVGFGELVPDTLRSLSAHTGVRRAVFLTEPEEESLDVDRENLVVLKEVAGERITHVTLSSKAQQQIYALKKDAYGAAFDSELQAVVGSLVKGIAV